MRPLMLLAALAVAAPVPTAVVVGAAAQTQQPPAAAHASRPRPPTAEERTRIEAALRAAGYTRWDEIEVREDTGIIEVDDARKGDDGREVDLKIEAATMRVMEDPGG